MPVAMLAALAAVTALWRKLHGREARGWALRPAGAAGDGPPVGRGPVRFGCAALKIKATALAGICAKALLVHRSATRSAVLPMSLATDLVDCRPLRDLLWSARGGET